MGIFSFNYSKPGPGVDKDAPQKKGIFRYFEIFFRKFWKLLQVNMLYFLTSIPLLLILYILAPISDSFVSGIISQADPELAAQQSALIQLQLRFFFATMLFVFWGSGPATAAYSYITRCFTREQHAWILSDFKDKFLENFKQAIIVVIIDIIIVFLSIFGINFYFVYYKTTGQQLWLFACCLMCTILLVYTFMHFYVYQFMVTFSSKLSQLYKNSLILALAQLPMNIFLTIVALAINFLLFNFLNPMFALFVDFLLGISLMRFPIEYSASRAIDKKILPYVNQTKVEYEDEDKGED